jgi:hypothetical protein
MGTYGTDFGSHNSGGLGFGNGFGGGGGVSPADLFPIQIPDLFSRSSSQSPTTHRHNTGGFLTGNHPWTISDSPDTAELEEERRRRQMLEQQVFELQLQARTLWYV